MKRIGLVVFAFYCSLFFGAAEPPANNNPVLKTIIDLNKNPYVMLYRSRLAGTQAMVLRSIAESKFEEARVERLKKLFNTRACSLEELQEGEMRLEVAKENILMSRALVEESEALLAVALERIRNGQDMPIHTLPLYPR